MEDIKNRVREVLTDGCLDYKQKKHNLAYIAESTQAYPKVSDEAMEALADKKICDLFEGSAPYRPRYILPDYKLALKKGIKYLELDPPTDFDEAINFLSILYSYVPSITGYSVYLGNIDQLLLPFVADLSEESIYKKLKLFWRYIDRTLPDAFVHINIGPEDNIIARAVLKVEREVKQVVPNLTLKYDTEKTSDALLNDAIKTVFEVAKPHIANHNMITTDFKGEYGVVSCYNSLPEGGGSHTLIRLNLKKITDQHSGNTDAFFAETLPKYCEMTLDIIEARIKYLVETVKYFETDFLAQEGIIKLENFSAMFGFYGLAECVNTLMKNEGHDFTYGHSEEANQLGHRIVEEMKQHVDARPLPYCEANNGRAFIHSQSGIDIDVEETAGARIPIGEEPDIYSHINAVAPHHHLINGGISDIFHFDDTVKRNPQAVLDIIKGAFKKGMRMFTFNIANSEFIRVTGYLVRRSDLKEFREEGSRYGSTSFAANSMDNKNVDKRIAKRVNSNERTASQY
ncbi:YjjI family glycine radical enzyme [Ancylomarina sp. 16SWW S1-10-2]|uniref:YjjI family glycine radical enzyme n=1 Tax=Ancylomarina sp. 16SWW S1-10-2 TaxID=2499681 RepID=UPI0012AD3CF8|nr:YjjI family glycine radical enzyme [Ancylomarina sp. 16SWW S1-10-2]MRT92367.1 YjjI family glycine radical enzyme [Ancylomarina sp. 16SWW S1-10-2]